jgi:hypothetical protein
VTQFTYGWLVFTRGWCTFTHRWLVGIGVFCIYTWPNSPGWLIFTYMWLDSHMCDLIGLACFVRVTSFTWTLDRDSHICDLFVEVYLVSTRCGNGQIHIGVIGIHIYVIEFHICVIQISIMVAMICWRWDISHYIVSDSSTNGFLMEIALKSQPESDASGCRRVSEWRYGY